MRCVANPAVNIPLLSARAVYLFIREFVVIACATVAVASRAAISGKAGTLGLVRVRWPMVTGILLMMVLNPEYC
jgi:hypothetical protein